MWLSTSVFYVSFFSFRQISWIQLEPVKYYWILLKAFVCLKTHTKLAMLYFYICNFPLLLTIKMWISKSLHLLISQSSNKGGNSKYIGIQSWLLCQLCVFFKKKIFACFLVVGYPSVQRVWSLAVYQWVYDSYIMEKNVFFKFSILSN